MKLIRLSIVLCLVLAIAGCGGGGSDSSSNSGGGDPTKTDRPTPDEAVKDVAQAMIQAMSAGLNIFAATLDSSVNPDGTVTIKGNCGGEMRSDNTYTIVSMDPVTVSFSGDCTFADFCVDGITHNGTGSLEGSQVVPMNGSMPAVQVNVVGVTTVSGHYNGPMTWNVDVISTGAVGQQTITGTANIEGVEYPISTSLAP